MRISWPSTPLVASRKLAQYVDSRLFERDSLPLWQVAARREAGENKEIFSSASSRLLGIRAFMTQASGGIVALFVLLILSLFCAYRLQQKARLLHAGE